MIDAEQGSYTVSPDTAEYDPQHGGTPQTVNTETGEIADNQESIDAERQQYEAERATAGHAASASAQASAHNRRAAAEPPVEPPWESFGGTQPAMQEPATERRLAVLGNTDGRRATVAHNGRRQAVATVCKICEGPGHWVTARYARQALNLTDQQIDSVPSLLAEAPNGIHWHIIRVNPTQYHKEAGGDSMGSA